MNGKLLTPFQRQLLLKKLAEDIPGLYRQRISIMLLADEGKSQREICRILGCCSATARHWIYIASSGKAHEWEASPVGRPKAINEEYIARLQELVNHHPHDYGYGFRRWTANWLSKHLAKEFGLQLSECHIKRLLKQMGLSTKGKSETASENTHEGVTCQISITDITGKSRGNSNVIVPIQLLKFKKN